MDSMDAFDTITSRCSELTGLAGIIEELAEKGALLNQEELDFIGSSVGRIAEEIHTAAKAICVEQQ